MKIYFLPLVVLAVVSGVAGIYRARADASLADCHARMDDAGVRDDYRCRRHVSLALAK